MHARTTLAEIDRAIGVLVVMIIVFVRMRMIVRKLAREYNLKPETVMRLIKTWAKG